MIHKKIFIAILTRNEYFFVVNSPDTGLCAEGVAEGR
jgi:hypothetical protein